MSLRDPFKVELARKSNLEKTVCRQCGATNPKAATKCRKCHSLNLRPKRTKSKGR
jgi:large subunit ribosomal protein L40e